MRTFLYRDATSHKSWSVEVSGSSFTVTYGRVGAAGRTQTKRFDSPDKARAEADKLIRQKLKKGYVETTLSPEAAQAEAFERAMAADPHDQSAAAVYSDWLQERGEPRGEFIRVQIALEDETQPKAARKRLQAREKELLGEHERGWLGPLAPHLIDRVPNRPHGLDGDPDLPGTPGTEHCWRRGFLAELKVDCLTVRLAQALADAPAVRLLQKLHVVSTAYYVGMLDETTPRRVPLPSNPGNRRGYRDYNEWFELLGAPMLKNLRYFQMGDIDGEPPEDGWTDNHTYAPGIELLIAEMPRIEELHLLCKHYDSTALFASKNLTNLRVMRLYALGDPVWSEEHDIELDVLARNPALGRLTHLMVHPHYAHESVLPLRRVVPVFRSPHLKSLVHLQLRLSNMGDEGVREIISSGILKRLKWLDLSHGRITDEGARLFAACPEARNLDRLDLSRNAVSATGLNVLRAGGVRAVANDPLTARELAEEEYLRDGDFE